MRGEVITCPVFRNRIYIICLPQKHWANPSGNNCFKLSHRPLLKKLLCEVVLFMLQNCPKLLQQFIYHATYILRS